MIVDEDFKTDIDTNTSQNNTITLRFSGDGRKTTKKTGSVMTTFCIPGSSRSPEKEYCISIYDGMSYVLHFVLTQQCSSKWCCKFIILKQINYYCLCMFV